MYTLKVIQQIAKIRKDLQDLIDGVIAAEEVEVELYKLAELLSGSTSVSKNIKPTAPIIQKESIIQPVNETDFGNNKLFMNENNILLFEIEKDKDGVAFQESHGYVIFVVNSHLKLLKPVSDKIKDVNGLEWTITLTDNEHVVSAENEIGDVIIGMKRVEELITGVEVREHN